jgi:hypothetical protein
LKTTANDDKKVKNGASGTPANVEKERDRKSVRKRNAAAKRVARNFAATLFYQKRRRFARIAFGFERVFVLFLLTPRRKLSIIRRPFSTVGAVDATTESGV